jgi:primosomal protein N' (replication factor Y)
MAAADRWHVLEQVRTGAKKILIGPRSAIFAAFENLRLIVVDEEHDNSYKQSSGLTYHGRDIAVVRGRLENACVILGSATPSLESYYNALKGKYFLLSLLERVGESRLPSVELVDSPPVAKRGVFADLRNSNDEQSNMWEIPIAPRIIEELVINYQRGEQSMVIVNRRGFACYLYSLKEEKPVSCPQCSISMTVHNKGKILRCHYCNTSLPIKKLMDRSGDSDFIAVGYGSQKAEDYLREVLKGAAIERIDSDSVAKKGFLSQKLEDFSHGKIDVLVGTQMLAKGHDFSNVTLIVLLEVDQILSLPDFRAGERVFQLLVQSAGRAGRGHLPGRVLMQTRRRNHAIIEAGIKQNYEMFAQKELIFREALGYPPFSRMVAIEIECKNKNKLSDYTNDLQVWFTRIMADQPVFFRAIRILGPSIPMAELVRGYFRRSILFSSADLSLLRRFIKLFSDFAKPPSGIRLKMDIDPQNIL